ncbi:hypothetical protein CYY_007892 [Polysphondylium violaceum]|uniref:Uncharacterized protein n=1 Tax=Polysphondylium violaceum TaxID=133409 RepID=A0A8J4UQK3_9MYCE|nr:hypothetical protein CYY_007892 [Polysphondylium violaceum]
METMEFNQDNFFEEEEEIDEDGIKTFTNCSQFLSIIRSFFEDFLKIMVTNGIYFPSISKLVIVLTNIKENDFIDFSNSIKSENFSLVRFLISKQVRLDPVFLETIMRLQFDSVWIYTEDGELEYDIPVVFEWYGDKLLEYLAFVNDEPMSTLTNL